jgi:hypothetical protein
MPMLDLTNDEFTVLQILLAKAEAIPTLTPEVIETLTHKVDCLALELRTNEILDGASSPSSTARTCSLAVLTIRRLERLARRATHGTSVPKIMANFIEAGVRQAINEGYLRQEDE